MENVFSRLKKNGFLIALALCAGLATAAPVLKDGIVTSMNKEVEYQPERGRFRIVADGELLAESSVCFHLVEKKTGVDRWLVNNGKNKGGWRVETGLTNGVYTYSAHLDLAECSWKHWTCTFELMPDGLIRYTQQGFPCPRPDLYDVRHASLFISVPKAVGANSTVATNGVPVKTRLGEKLNLGSGWRAKDMSFAFFAGDPAREIGFLLPEGHGVDGRTLQVRADGSVSGFLSAEKTPKTLYIDIRKGVAKATSPFVRGGIDLMKVEKLVPPDDTGKNLLPNGSFECGLKGWFHRAGGLGGDYWAPGRWETVWYETVAENAKFGTRALKCHADFDPEGRKWDPRRLRHAFHIGSMPILLDKGTYTLSFWAKAADEDTQGYVWCPVYAWADGGYMSSFTHRTKDAQKTFTLGTEWRKVTLTFEQKKADPWYLMLNCHNRTKASTVWMDGFQLEKGTAATDFAAPVAEAELLTSEKANFIDAAEKIAARLRVVTAPNAKGTVRVRAKLPEGRELYDKTFTFAADAAGESFVTPDFEGFGNGLFVLRYDFTVDGKTHCQHDRLTRTPYTIGRDFRWKKLFASMYGDESFRPDAPRLFDRQAKCGIGAADAVTECPTGRALYHQYGIEPGLTHFATDSYHCMRAGLQKNAVRGIIVGENDRILARRSVLPGKTEGTELLISQHTIEGVPLDDAYLARFKDAVKTRVRRHMDVIWWEFSSELQMSVWGEKADPVARAAMYAQYLKAFVEGVHEANPKALAFTESPCNLSQSGIQEICDVLTALDRLGGKVDGVSAHPYRYAPENPDLEESILEVMAHLRKLGYPETTPFAFGEMMHWGPYEIPALGTESSSWAGPPRTWSGGTLSYDLGTTERRSAAWRARSWLVGLKYADRILCMVAGSGNNWDLDALQTPRLTQLVSATLCDLLGNATFKADIRFAPFVRAFAFEDEKGRPVVATWCHKEEVDFEREAAPEAVAAFADDLEGVFDISGHFTPAADLKAKDGKVRFALAGCPKYWRFKAGSTDRVLAALRKARVVSGVGISPIRLSAKPAAPDRVTMMVANFLSDDFPLTIADAAGRAKAVTVPASGKATVDWPVSALRDDALVATPLKVTAKSKEGGAYGFDLSCRGHLIRRVSDEQDETTVDWTKIPAIPLENRVKNPGRGFAAKFRCAWNAKGLLLRVEVEDASFSHREHAEAGRRWDNDCLQVYLDTFLTARSGVASCYDADDYDYAVFPNAAGTSARVWRMRGADQQLSVGVSKVKRDNDWCDTSRAHFSKTADGYVYTVLLSEEDVMPLRLEKGQAFGFGVQAVDANDGTADFHSQKNPKGRVDGQLNDGEGGKGFYNPPAALPAALLWDPADGENEKREAITEKR